MYSLASGLNARVYKLQVVNSDTCENSIALGVKTAVGWAGFFLGVGPVVPTVMSGLQGPSVQ